MLVTLQNDLSLFSRGDKVDFYLFDWALYTVVLLGSCWFVLILTSCFVGGKRVNENETLRTVLMAIKTVFQESAIIIIHLLTISEIALYATATFKFILSNQ